MANIYTYIYAFCAGIDAPVELSTGNGALQAFQAVPAHRVPRPSPGPARPCAACVLALAVPRAKKKAPLFQTPSGRASSGGGTGGVVVVPVSSKDEPPLPAGPRRSRGHAAHRARRLQRARCVWLCFMLRIRRGLCAFGRLAPGCGSAGVSMRHMLSLCPLVCVHSWLAAAAASPVRRPRRVFSRAHSLVGV